MLKNYRNSRGWGWGYDKHPLESKFQGVGGSKAKVPSVVGYGYFPELHIILLRIQTSLFPLQGC